MQKAVEFVSQGLTLRGMLHVPDNAGGKLPLAIIFHGFTGNKMEPHFMSVKLSRLLEKKGIASVRFDFGGSGESDGDFVNMTLSGELNDAHNILDYVKTLEFVDVSRIAAVGLSMGGAVASMLAGERKDDIQALCLWAPAGNIKDIVYSKGLDGKMDIFRKAGYADFGGLLLGVGFVDDVLELDIYKKAEAYDKNVFIVHGDDDPTVPLSASEKYMEIYGSRGRLHVVKGADHTFNSKMWEDEVLKETSVFLEKELL